MINAYFGVYISGQGQICMLQPLPDKAQARFANGRIVIR